MQSISEFMLSKVYYDQNNYLEGTYLTGVGGAGLLTLLISLALVHTSLLLIFFVSFTFFSTTFGFKDGGSTLSFDGRSMWDFFTIWMTELGVVGSFLGVLGTVGPPGSGALILSGRFGLMDNFVGRLSGGFAGSALFSFTFVDSDCGAKSKLIVVRKLVKS